MTWLAETLHRYPELAIFLVVGLGYWFGAFKIRGVGLGPVTGSLLVGLVLGYLVDIPVSGTAKQLLFLLFLFSIGYSVGPRFFTAMRGGGGWRWPVLSTVVCCTGLATAYAVATLLHL